MIVTKPDILMTRGKGGVCLYLVVYHDSKPDILMTRGRGGEVFVFGGIS